MNIIYGMKQKTVKIISGNLLAIAYISFTVAGFMDGLQEGLVIMGECTFGVLVAVLLIFCVSKFNDESRDL